jgi:flavorubredoxin
MGENSREMRELADGLYWLGGCQQRLRRGEEVHTHASAFLVVGSDRSLLVDTGHPSDWDVVDEGLTRVLGDTPLDYVFPTHTEYPHAGNLRRLIRKYPFVDVVGDVRDYHMYLPDLFVRGNFVAHREHDAIDLGGRTFAFIPAALRDLPNTLWGHDSNSGCMFVSDGFAYAHRHRAGQCRLLSSEYVDGPDHAHAVRATETALFWPMYAEIDDYWHWVERLLERYPVRMIAPAHGGVIDEPVEMIPRLKQVLVDMRKKQLKLEAQA